jgi:hypothetical protein
MAVQEIEELGLKRRAGPIGVEVGKKRVLWIFTNLRGLEPRCEPLCQSGFAGADGAVDRDVSKVQLGSKCTASPAFARCASARPGLL